MIPIMQELMAEYTLYDCVLCISITKIYPTSFKQTLVSIIINQVFLLHDL